MQTFRVIFGIEEGGYEQVDVKANSEEDAVRFVVAHKFVPNIYYKDVNKIKETGKGDTLKLVTDMNGYAYIGEDPKEVEYWWKKEQGKTAQHDPKSAQARVYCIWGNITYKYHRHDPGKYKKEAFINITTLPQNEQNVDGVIKHMLDKKFKYTTPPDFKTTGWKDGVRSYRSKSGWYVLAGPNQQTVKEVWTSLIKPLDPPRQPGGQAKNIRYGGVREIRRNLRDLL